MRAALAVPGNSDGLWAETHNRKRESYPRCVRFVKVCSAPVAIQIFAIETMAQFSAQQFWAGLIGVLTHSLSYWDDPNTNTHGNYQNLNRIPIHKGAVHFFIPHSRSVAIYGDLARQSPPPWPHDVLDYQNLNRSLGCQVA